MGPDLVEVGKRIRSLRKGRYRTLKDFADCINVSERHLHNIETGKNLPGIELLIDIANEFHVTIDFILFGPKKRLLFEENLAALQDTFNNLSTEGRQSLNHIALELVRLEQKLQGGSES
ncbi:helix-turn-helix domain-containing protein [Paenibacillus elgii]|uniref:helix-turn-helix domain-containing protein n=1 Tax=Paenibacillus elgii TaxID=189691 RepID=UPI002041739B|nr:helix-turn-helix transcriptional regulator [Paenibacillus elgii]MCM3269097.1 helix-turn-helix domain-containing protein [Paenibacillus elgii]